MHSLSPPLIHRDLKVRRAALLSSTSSPCLVVADTLISLTPFFPQVENILQSTAHSFKLCDFGSVATARPPPSTVAEMREVELDINTHTTIQYRAPEMVDVYQRRVIDEKSGEWHNLSLGKLSPGHWERARTDAPSYATHLVSRPQTFGRSESCSTSCAITRHPCESASIILNHERPSR